MKYIRHIPSKNIFPQGCVATIGNFDGVHRGHQTIIAGLRARAREMGLPLVIITFDPHPEEFFLGDKAPPRLTNCRDRLTVMRELGVDYAICLSFNARLAETTAEAFIQDYLIDGLRAKYLLVGDDFHFGKGRQGNIEMLRDWSRQGGYEVGCRATFVDENQRISSTRIRSRLQHGDLEEAERLLGRPYTISGRVVHGDKRGRSWGFPTANLLLNREPPLSGVFAVDVSGLGESKRAGVANLGRRPTVGGNRLLLETHLLDFDREIYGERICVEFLHKIRDERKFESFEELKSRIAQDLLEAREIFTAHEKTGQVESPVERAQWRGRE